MTSPSWGQIVLGGKYLEGLGVVVDGIVGSPDLGSLRRQDETHENTPVIYIRRSRCHVPFGSLLMAFVGCGSRRY